ncbi:uncharacterized protein LOC142330648 [Lycorma delicatula]|uniref:uncharacterized protein LOC142330648 n=1 Tax=Lycorma delicatula TaxID=130591 RepID=UPI003F510FDC
MDNKYKRVRLEAVQRMGEFTLIENAFACNLLTYYYKNDNDVCSDVWLALQNASEHIVLILTESLARYGSVKFNILIELTYKKPMTGDIKDVGFKTNNFDIYSINDIDNAIQNATEQLLEEEASFEGKQSGWTLITLDGILVRVNKFRPLRGSCYIPLPSKFQQKHAVINIKNEDEFCFKWSILCRFVKGTHRERVDMRYKTLLDKFEFHGITFPTPLGEIKIFEEKNNVSVNVYSFDEKGIIFPVKVIPVRDHCHLTGKYRAALCNKCNLQRRNQTFLPVFLHNSSNYDSHFIVKELGYDEKRINLIPNTTEKYISFTKTIDELHLVTRKGVYPYEYTSSWEVLEDTQLPPKEKFYSSLTGENIDENDYIHAKTVWSHFNIKNLGEYSDLYLKCDVLLLADVFENFRLLCLREYGLDCAYYFTLPGFSFDAMLYKTRVSLELITDYDIYLFLERGIRGGISVCVKKYAKANNPYIPEEYDNKLPHTYLAYLDANNLYGWAMSQHLPKQSFRWVEKEIQQSIADSILSFKDDGIIGFIFEVDVEYPEFLHNTHSDLPFLPINEVPPFSSHTKLVTTLKTKNNYICHYVNLKQAIRNGLRVTKVHKILQFIQSPWLKSYINLNTINRQSATNDFEKDLFKLMNNAVFGKCMENVRKRINLELVSSEKRLMKLIAKPTFKDRIIYNENLCAVQCTKEKIKLDKPLYVGLSVLELSKTLMYNFHYNIMKKKYRSKINLLYMDTDSFFYEIETHDFYQDLQDESFIEYFDTSDFPVSHPLFSIKNKKVLGKFKDECNGIPIKEFIGLRAKLYTFTTTKGITKKAKGIKKNVVKNKLNINHYRNCLLKASDDSKDLYVQMKLIRSKKHLVETVTVNKLALSSYDDKRVAVNNILTLPWGHVDIPLELKRLFNH